MFNYLFPTKKSQIMVKYIAMWVMAFGVVFIMLNATRSFASGEADAKFRHTKEIALLIEAASAVQGNSKQTYFC